MGVTGSGVLAGCCTTGAAAAAGGLGAGVAGCGAVPLAAWPAGCCAGAAAPKAGVVNRTSLEGGLVVPSARAAATVATYEVAGRSPSTSQLAAAVSQAVVTHALPPTGHTVRS